jgi:hypothetical protein
VVTWMPGLGAGRCSGCQAGIEKDGGKPHSLWHDEAMLPRHCNQFGEGRTGPVDKPAEVAGWPVDR